MSFLDPDLREQWARDAERRRQECSKRGAHRYLQDFKCGDCGAADPESLKPYVCLVAGDFRVVHDRHNQTAVIEKRTTDSVGAERWDHVETVGSTNPRNEKSTWPLFALLTKGRAP